MISTVTITTLDILANVSVAGTITLIIFFLLTGLLIQKEFAVSSTSSLLKRLNRILNVGIIPLIIAFITIVAIQVFSILYNW